MKFLIKLALTAFVLSLPLFANSVATITALKGSAKIESVSASMEATLGAKLEAKDNIVTADKSKVQIIFNDNTTVTVGKKSHFSIAEYIYDDSSEPSVEFGLFKGAVKVITGRIGKIAPDKFKLKTKTATIGIRGTNFHVVNMEDGSFRAYCTYGAISVTVKGESFVVEQGFYLQVSQRGKITVTEFSADELKGMNSDHFGEPGPLKGEASEDGLEIDNSTDSNDGIIIKDVSDKTQDAVQTAIPNASSIFMSGWSVDNDVITDLQATVSLNFLDDGSSFDSATSWVEVFNRSNIDEALDDWSFYLSPTASSFISKDDFTTTFSSVYLTPGASSTSSNAELLSSSFSTHADLAEGDYMLWGEWSANVKYDYAGYIGPESSTHDFQGLWIAGEATAASVIAARTGSAYYTGDYRTIDASGATLRVDGGAGLSVDFGADTASLYIGSYSFSDMPITGNGFSGSTVSQGTGSANGTFYGPTGDSAGGNFQIIDGTTTNVKGVYQVTEETQISETVMY